MGCCGFEGVCGCYCEWRENTDNCGVAVHMYLDAWLQMRRQLRPAFRRSCLTRLALKHVHDSCGVEALLATQHLNTSTSAAFFHFSQTIHFCRVEK